MGARMRKGGVSRGDASRSFLWPAALLAVALAALGAASGAVAANFTVTNTGDSTVSGSGSLRDAVAEANVDSNLDVITFAPGVTGTITLTHGPLAITNPVEIQGPGAETLTVSGNDAGRVFTVASGASATISGLTVSDGRITGENAPAAIADGGAGANGADGGTAGSDEITDGDPGADAAGAGILNEGALVLEEMVVSRNRGIAGVGGDAEATGGKGGNGGAIETETGGTGGNGEATGASGGDALGAGIGNSGNLIIENSTVSDNVALAGDGGDATATGGTGGDGDAAPGGGGGNATAIGGAGGDARGAAVYSDSGTLELRNSTVSENTTIPGSPGAAQETGGSPGTDGTALGGSGGSADATSGQAGTTTGGGIQVAGGTATVTSGTVARNEAATGANLFGSSSTTVENSILAEPRGAGANCNGPVTSNGHNIDSGTSCGFAQATDKPSTDPMLGPLQDNGGPTETHALPKLSPAVDAGTAAGLATDQRGEARPSDFTDVANASGSDGSDIGAFELQAPPPPPPPPPPAEEPPAPPPASEPAPAEPQPAAPGGSPTSPPAERQCAGKTATIVVAPGQNKPSTSGPDVVVGTDGDDTILVGSGNDVVCALGGDDVVRGGGGKDTIVGGEGKDRIAGGDGNDSLTGEGAADILVGGPGKDRCNGGPGKDTTKGC